MLRRFAYDNWANKRLLGALREMPSPPPSALRLLAHIQQAHLIWRLRITRKPYQHLSRFVEMTLPQMETLLAENLAEYTRILEGADASGMDEFLEYMDTMGRPHRNRLRDMLEQVLMHAMYHRGQIAAILRAEGVDPPGTDFIIYCREESAS